MRHELLPALASGSPGTRSGLELNCRGCAAAGQRPRFLLALSFLVAGCQLPLERQRADEPPPSANVAGNGARLRREAGMNERWQNRSFSELVSAMGQPLLVITIPGEGNPPGFAVVYSQETASGCIDAFALFHGRDPTIRIYHCR
jgi:hypothetical protein